jgi:PrgI family protein
MLGKHEIPTHLEVEDKILFGLTVRQVLVLGFGLAIGYALWQHLGPSHTVTPGSHFLAHASLSSPVPAPLRILLAAIPFAGSAIIAFYRHGGRSAEDWMLAYARYLAAPKVSLWRTLPASSARSADSFEMELALLVSPLYALPRHMASGERSSISLPWSSALEEYESQGDRERIRVLPPSPALMALETLMQSGGTTSGAAHVATSGPRGTLQPRLEAGAESDVPERSDASRSLIAAGSTR